MKYLHYLYLIIILLAVGGITESIAGQQMGGFTIQNADATNYLDTTGSSELNTIIQNVPPRFIYERADSILNNGNVDPIDSALLALFQDVPPRFVYERADAIGHSEVSYPRLLINDNTSPSYVEVNPQASGDGTVYVYWTTTEFTTSTLQYGTQSGNYANTQTNNEYYISNVFIVTNAVSGVTYYGRLTNVDRNGNAIQSSEFTFQVNRYLYLPYVNRR